MSFSHRPVEPADLSVICGFAQSAQELFHIFPKAEFPLDPRLLENAIRDRHAPTVAIVDGSVAGFADLYGYEPGKHCFIGNVIVDPARRGQGVGRNLVRVMVRQAAESFDIKTVNLSCFSDNVSALLMYAEMGFHPYTIERRQAPDGAPAALLHMAIPTTPDTGHEDAP